jgi:hypothetical protein
MEIIEPIVADNLNRPTEMDQARLAEWYASGALTRAHRRDLKDYLLRIRLDRWLTALEVDYRPDDFWQAALGNSPTLPTKI